MVKRFCFITDIANYDIVLRWQPLGFILSPAVNCKIDLESSMKVPRLKSITCLMQFGFLSKFVHLRKLLTTNY